MSFDYTNEVKKLRETFATRKTFDVEWRIKQLKRLEAMVVENQPLIEEALRKDLGWSKETTALSETDMMLTEVRYTLEHLKEWAKPQPAATPLLLKPSTSYLVKEPLGVILVISPWNFPVHLAINPVIDALAAGNCVVLKPSEVSVHSSHLLATLVPRYLDSTVVTVIEGGVDETTALLKQRFDHIVYTGNGRVAKFVMRAAAEHLTPVTLELGGKNPCIVDKDANLEVTARRLVWGKFMNCGQLCITADYVIAHPAIERELISKVQKYIKEFYGADVKKSKDYPRIINVGHVRRLKALIEEKGQFELVSGGEVDESDRYIAPTILRDVNPKAKVIVDGEIFGPILPIISSSLFPPEKFLDSAIAFALQFPKPLAAYLFSSNTASQEQFTTQLPFGGGCINDIVIHGATPHLPFGGVGESGIGAYHGKVGFERFSHLKGILNSTTFFDPSLRYPPYTARGIKILNTMKSFNPQKLLFPLAIVLAVTLAFFAPAEYSFAQYFSKK